MPRLKGFRERYGREVFFTLVSQGESVVINKHHRFFQDQMVDFGDDGPFIAKMVRIDAFIDDYDAGRAIGWRNFLAGARFTTIVGSAANGPNTIRAGLPHHIVLLPPAFARSPSAAWQAVHGDAPHGDEAPDGREAVALSGGDEGSVDTMLYATCDALAAMDLQVTRRQRLGVEIEYTGPESIPLGFLRVVFIGITTRDVQ